MSAHPLDPLSAAEQESLVKAARAAWKLDHRHLVAMLQLHEPTKEFLSKYKAGDAFPRFGRITIWDQEKAMVSEGVISTSGEVQSYTDIPGAKAPVLAIESERAIEIARKDQRVIDALKKRGINSADDVHMETWPIGAKIPDYIDDGRRVIWTPMWHKRDKDGNFYAHPINGLHAIVDIDKFEVVGIEDDEQTPIPQTAGPYRESQQESLIHLKELSIHQPEGPSFTVNGWRIDWERWNFRVGFDQREGLVIHDVRFNDNGNERKIAHRLSIAELVIPYGDPSQGAYRKNAFDTGEYGLGNFTNSLTLGCDCLGEIV